MGIHEKKKRKKNWAHWPVCAVMNAANHDYDAIKCVNASPEHFWHAYNVKLFSFKLKHVQRQEITLGYRGKGTHAGKKKINRSICFKEQKTNKQCIMSKNKSLYFHC